MLAKQSRQRLHSLLTSKCKSYATSTSFPPSVQKWSLPPTRASVADDEVARLSALPRHVLTLADLVKHGHPPLSEPALLTSANFTLSLLPARLAYRIQCLRNLPYIVVSNPHISHIYNNYLHSLTILLPYQKRPITTLEEEAKFTGVLADLVQTHANTIPILAKGFMECRKYISPAEVTRFLEEHLRARIGTRLIAEQHLALHLESRSDGQNQHDSRYVGVIDTALRPADIVRACEERVAEICELRYGVRPSVTINGQPEATFAHVPVHLEYILTELLKNAFRATVESGHEREPVEITIAPAPDIPSTASELNQRSLDQETPRPYNEQWEGSHAYPNVPGPDMRRGDGSASNITIRIRDRGGGIAPEILPNIWSYSFTTFGDKEASSVDNGNTDGLNALSESGGTQSSIAGLGYGLPLGRAYAEYFSGGIAVQSLFGWGTDVYLTLQGVGQSLVGKA